MKCIQCTKEFDAPRSDAKFCSPKCRVASNRGAEAVEAIKDHPEVLDGLVGVLKAEGRSVEDINGILKVHEQGASEGRKPFTPVRVLRKMGLLPKLEIYESKES